MIYNFRFDRDSVEEILRRLREEQFISQGWGGRDHNLHISKPDFVQRCQEIYELKTTQIPTNISRIRDFKKGELLVTPHLPEYGKVSIHVIDGDFPECYDYLENDPSHLNHRIKIRKSYGLDGSISIDNYVLVPWREKLQSLRLPVLPIEQDEQIFRGIIRRIESGEQVKFNAQTLELKKLTVENFKAFQNCVLELAPLTILIGENSSGKSSLLQALLLLKQTLDSPSGRGILNLSGDVQFHNFREIVFGMPINEAFMRFELAFQDHKTLSFKVGIQEKGNQLNLFDIRFNDKALSWDKEWEKWDIEQKVSDNSDSHATLRSMLNHYLRLPEVAGQLNEEALTLMFTGIGYIQPLRPIPQRYYNLTGVTPSWIGSRAENIADFLETHPTVKKQVQDWFVESAKMAREVKFKTDFERDQMEIIFVSAKSGLEIDISRLGFGFSQILPIVVATYAQKNMLIFEAPEIHLNPKLHGVMTDLFIEGANNGKQVLVETHSEHVVYRVQRRIADGKIAPDAVALYYVQQGENGSIAERLTLTEKGSTAD
jgi:ABC-type polar amino acid transport system ATPase subunit